MPYPPDFLTGTWITPTQSLSSYVRYPGLSNSFGGTTPFTVALWLNVVATWQSPRNRILAVTSDGSSFSTLLYSGNTYGNNSLVATWSNYSLVSLLTLSEWNYVTITNDGRTMILYINAAPVKSATVSRFSSVKTPAFWIGADALLPPSGSTGPLIGAIRNFAYWDVALPAESIGQQMFATGAAVVDGLQILTDYTQDPPLVYAGPTPIMAPTNFKMESYAIQTLGADTASPGPASAINPSKAAPFSLIAWVCANQYTLDNSEKKPATTAEGCIFSNGDATSEASMSLEFDDGNPIVVFGDGQSVRAHSVLRQSSWNSIAVTYDGQNCAIYVNGALENSQPVVTGSSPASAAPLLLGQMSGGAPVKLFSGLFQSLSVWDVALTSQEINQWQYSDPSSEERCVANINAAVNPPQDLVAVANDAIWEENFLLLGASMTWIATTQVSPPDGTPSVSAASSQPPARRRRIRRLHVPRRRPARRAPDVPFGSAHRERMRREFDRALVWTSSDEQRRQLRAAYAAQLDEIFDAAASGRLDYGARLRPADGGFVLDWRGPEGIRTLANVTVEPLEDGESLLTFVSPSGEVLSRVQARLDSCFVWWVDFMTTSILGILKLLNFQTPPALLDVILSMCEVDSLTEALSTITQTTAITGTVVLSIFRIVVEWDFAGGLASVLLEDMLTMGTVAIFSHFYDAISITPNPVALQAISEASTLAAAIALQLATYSSACA